MTNKRCFVMRNDPQFVLLEVLGTFWSGSDWTAARGPWIIRVDRIMAVHPLSELDCMGIPDENARAAAKASIRVGSHGVSHPETYIVSDTVEALAKKLGCVTLGKAYAPSVDPRTV